MERASAASIAGLKKLVGAGAISRREEVVCVTTGHGLKDPEVIGRVCEKLIQVKVDQSSIKRALGLTT